MIVYDIVNDNQFSKFKTFFENPETYGYGGTEDELKHNIQKVFDEDKEMSAVFRTLESDDEQDKEYNSNTNMLDTSNTKTVGARDDDSIKIGYQKTLEGDY